MLWNLHHIIIEGISNNATLAQSWATSFASLPTSTAAPDLHFELNVVPDLPPAPDEKPHYQQGDLLGYYVHGPEVTAHFPRFGQLRLNLEEGRTHGRIISAALNTYGVLEDLLAIGLSPHLRRRGLFLIHAFAAVYNQKAVLLVGGIHAGKTTTGMSLLNGGWKLLSNDSPIVNDAAEILSYPGVLAGYPDSFARFEATAAYAAQQPITQEGRKKLLVPAEEVWPDVWCERAPLAAILFPHIASGEHVLTKLNPAETLRRLLPHAIEQWDTAMIPAHLGVLRNLVEQAPAYDLALGPDVGRIPGVLQEGLI